MSWRNHKDHKAETKAVKAALLADGIKVRKVGHGTGTAWGWLHVKLDAPRNDHSKNTQAVLEGRFSFAPCYANCPACTAERSQERDAYAIIRDVTGRTGEYDGEVNISTDYPREKVSA